MNISTSYASQLLVSRASQSYTTTSQTAQKPSDDSTSTQESTVTISAVGKQASKIEVGSLESYRLPNWEFELKPKQYLIDGEGLMKESRAHMKLFNELYADGEISASDKQVMKEYRTTNSSAHQTYRDNAAFLKKYEDELSEYAKIFDQAYDQAKLEHGIETREDYVDKILNAPGDNIPLRNSVVEKLLYNPRALELMDTLGIKRPSLT